MRKIPLLVVACALSLCVAAQTNDRAYNFPVRPGTPAWKTFTTHAQMLEATKLPPAVVSNLTTSALVETCFGYPLLSDMAAFNSLQQGLDAVASRFNGLQELLARRDAAAHLLRKYRQLISTDVNALPTLIKRGELSFHLAVVELLLSQRQVLANIDRRTALQLESVKQEARKFRAAHADVIGTWH
jgi:hypothetical protein